MAHVEGTTATGPPPAELASDRDSVGLLATRSMHWLQRPIEGHLAAVSAAARRAGHPPLRRSDRELWLLAVEDEVFRGVRDRHFGAREAELIERLRSRPRGHSTWGELWTPHIRILGEEVERAARALGDDPAAVLAPYRDPARRDAIAQRLEMIDGVEPLSPPPTPVRDVVLRGRRAFAWFGALAGGFMFPIWEGAARAVQDRVIASAGASAADALDRREARHFLREVHRPVEPFFDSDRGFRFVALGAVEAVAVTAGAALLAVRYRVPAVLVLAILVAYGFFRISVARRVGAWQARQIVGADPTALAELREAWLAAVTRSGHELGLLIALVPLSLVASLLSAALGGP